MNLKKLTKLFEKTEDKEIDLVGVAVETPVIDNSMIESPSINLVKTNFFGAISIAFSPIGERQFKQLNTLASIVEKEGTGKREQDIVDAVPADPEEVALGEYTPTGNTFFVTLDIEPEITKDFKITKFVLNGMKYLEADVTRELTKDKEITLRFLFKEHDDSHAALAGLLNQRLTKSSIFKLLSLVSGSNVLGLPITYIARADKYTASALMPITASIELVEDAAGYTFIGDTGSITVYKNSIKNAAIEKHKDGSYKMTIKSGINGAVIIGFHA